MIRTLNRQLAGEKDFPVVSKILGAAIGKLGIDFASMLYSTVSGQLNKQLVSPYDRLCTIYESFATEPDLR